MNKIISIALLAGGVALIVCGIDASNSVGSSFSRWFTGSPTEKTTWFLVVGGIAAVVGVGGLLHGSKSS